MRVPSAAGAAAILSVTALGAAVAVGRTDNGSMCDFHWRTGKVSFSVVVRATSPSGQTVTDHSSPPAASSPPVALGQALQSGAIPDRTLAGTWIKLANPRSDAVAFFRGTGVSESGHVRKGQIVMGDVTTVAHADDGWSDGWTSWRYCDPAIGKADTSVPHAVRGPDGATYTLTFPQDQDGGIGMECAPGTFTHLTQSGDVTKIGTPGPLSGINLTALRRCVAFHHGTLETD